MPFLGVGSFALIDICLAKIERLLCGTTPIRLRKSSR